jgi:hypothetical protein
MDKVIEDLKALVDQGPDWAKERASIALDLHTQHQAGDISDDECVELLEDLVRTDQLDKAADDLDMKNKLVVSVMALKNVIGAIL